MASVSRDTNTHSQAIYQTGPQIVQSNRRNVDTINQNPSARRIRLEPKIGQKFASGEGTKAHKSEDTHGQCRLATTRTSKETDTLLRIQCK